MTIRLLSILSFIFLLLACDDEQSEVKKSGKVKLSINTVGNATGRTNSDNLDKIKKIVVSIETAAGTSVHDMHTLELVRFNNSFVSEELELEPGTYNVTKFFVTDTEKNVLYATPLENSDLASLVADPLPVSFVVNADGAITEVFMEAVNIEETLPEDFGYVTFALGLIEHKSFEVSATIADESHTGPVNGTFEVLAKNSNGAVIWSKEWSIADSKEIIVPVANRYSFTLSKAGHISHSQHYAFTDINDVNNLYFELIPEGSTDFIVKQLNGGKTTLYYPSDKAKLYLRVDMAENFKPLYLFTDRSAVSLTGTTLFPLVFSEVDEPSEFAGHAVNMFDNVPFADAVDIEDQTDMSASMFVTDFDRDVPVESYTMAVTLDDEFADDLFDFNFDYVAYKTYWCQTTGNFCNNLSGLSTGSREKELKQKHENWLAEKREILKSRR